MSEFNFEFLPFDSTADRGISLHILHGFQPNASEESVCFHVLPELTAPFFTQRSKPGPVGVARLMPFEGYSANVPDGVTLMAPVSPVPKPVGA